MVPQLREDVLKLAWRAWQDLNLRLSAPEADVLSTELQALNFSKSLLDNCFRLNNKFLN